MVYKGNLPGPERLNTFFLVANLAPPPGRGDTLFFLWPFGDLEVTHWKSFFSGGRLPPMSPLNSPLGLLWARKIMHEPVLLDKFSIILIKYSFHTSGERISRQSASLRAPRYRTCSVLTQRCQLALHDRLHENLGTSTQKVLGTLL